jgi:hypothetical protein
MSGGGTQLRNRSAKVLQLHPREVNRFAIERDGPDIKIVIECHNEYASILV